MIFFLNLYIFKIGFSQEHTRGPKFKLGLKHTIIIAHFYISFKNALKNIKKYDVRSI